jgi:6,7-dimethyl-8-ribityllumazine synthase
MSSVNNNLSVVKGGEAPSAEDFIFGIIYSEWNSEITEALKEGATKTLLVNGAKKENIIVRSVPGSFELVLGAQFMIEQTAVDAVICLGCVIQGETRHFDFICEAVAHGIMQLNIDFELPVIFGVLTTDNQQQAIDRCGGKHGNKGDEAAITAIKMLALQDSF